MITIFLLVDKTNRSCAALSVRRYSHHLHTHIRGLSCIAVEVAKSQAARLVRPFSTQMRLAVAAQPPQHIGAVFVPIGTGG
jgi:hypothetical protein